MSGSLAHVLKFYFFTLSSLKAGKGRIGNGRNESGKVEISPGCDLSVREGIPVLFILQYIVLNKERFL